jgi:hypothetical protein
MNTYVLTAQDVAGDPASDGSEMVVLPGKTTTLIFSNVGDSFAARDTAGRVSIAGLATDLTFTYLGYGNVRGDATEQAVFVRINLASGGFKTVAIDMNDDGAPELTCGATGLRVKSLSKTMEKPFPVSPSCFTGGTLVRTENGDCMVEDLRPGMMIWTLENGFAPLRKVLRSRVSGNGRYAPILFCAGSIGNDEPLLVSPNHRLLLEGDTVGEDELIAAKYLTNSKSIVRFPMPVVEYYHLVLDGYEIVDTSGALSESYFPEVIEAPRAAATKAATVAHTPWMSDVEYSVTSAKYA